MIQTAAFKAIDQLRDLPPGEAENFADAFRETSERLAEKQRALSLRRQEHPMELPDPLPKANVKEFPKTRKRAMTGAEAAEWRELEIRREERRAAIQDAADRRIEAVRDSQRLEHEEVAAAFLDQEASATTPNRAPTMLFSPSESFSEGDIDSSSSDEDEPRRSGRQRKPSRKIASQLAREALDIERKSKGKKKVNNRRRIRRSKLNDVSQLLDEFDVDPNNQLA
jgi:hypothetical protein